MGLRATVIRKYEVEYGLTEGFNYGADGLSAIIGAFCDDYYTGDDGNGGSDTAVVWEIDREQFKRMLELIKSMSHEEFVSAVRDYSYYEDEWDKEYIVQVFEGFLAETPEDYAYVRFAWL
jgi:hypothetical protein